MLTGLPCSVVSNLTNSALCASKAAEKARSCCLRCSTDVFFQDLKAMRAALMAASTSSGVETGQGKSGSFVAGLTAVLVDAVLVSFPSMMLEKLVKSMAVALLCWTSVIVNL